MITARCVAGDDAPVCSRRTGTACPCSPEARRTRRRMLSLPGISLRYSTMSSDAPNPAQNARLLLKQLEQNYSVFRNAVPLAVGIDKAIIARMPDIDRKVLRIALGMHTRSVRYLKVMEKSPTRFDLDGNPAGELPESHRFHASQMRKERVAKAQQQQKEKQRAEREQAVHNAKLQQLAEKFSPRR